MTPRIATQADAAMIAHIHVQAWVETYTGLLPDDEIAARPYVYRHALWTKIIAAGHSRVYVIDDIGFAQIGPQREDAFKDAYPEELYAIYLRQAGYGTGAAQSLLRAAVGPRGKPFNACVLANNPRACRFYEKSGARHVTTRNEMIGQTPIVERIYGWDDPARVFTD